MIPKSAYNISEEEAVEMIISCAFEESDGEKYYEQELEYATMPITLEEKIEEMGEHVEEKIDAKMEEQVEKINEKIEEQTRKIMKMLKKRRVKEEETKKSLPKKRKM